MNTLIQRFKTGLKARLLVKLHAEPAITSQLATKVLRDGLPRFPNWDYASERTVYSAILTLLGLESLITNSAPVLQDLVFMVLFMRVC